MISFFKGAGYCLKGFRWCWQSGLRRYVIPPLLINLGFMVLLLWLGSIGLTPITDWVQSWLPQWLHWLQWLFIGLYFIGIIWLGFLLLSVLIHWVAMPFNDALSEAVERKVNQHKRITDNTLEKTWVRQVGHAMKDAVARGWYTLKWLMLIGALVLILSFIPGVNMLAPWLMVTLGGWLLSLEYFDYPLARRGYAFTAQRDILGQRRLAALGFGMVTGLMLAIPVVNLLVIPAAVIGATLYVCDNQHAIDNDS